MIAFADVIAFLNMLFSKYNIRMFQGNENRSSVSYVGETYSNMGNRFVITVNVRQDRVFIQIFDVTGQKKVCVFQKSYTSLNDMNNESKFLSLFNFLDKTLLIA